MNRFVFNPSVLPKLNAAPFMSAEMLSRAKTIETYARSIAPVKSGRYRESLKTTSSVESGRATGRVSSDLDYAVPIEVGTRDTPTFAVLRRAAETVGGTTSMRR